MSFTVVLKHKEFGKVMLHNITEIHFCYPRILGKRIAFESDTEGTGCTYDLSDVIEFEAVEHSVNTDGGNGAAQPKAECEDCRLPYESFLLDVTLPDEQWLAIHPSGKDGLLCARCIVARASKLSNVVAVRAVFDLG
jgi:hypothetical protein